MNNLAQVFLKMRRINFLRRDIRLFVNVKREKEPCPKSKKKNLIGPIANAISLLSLAVAAYAVYSNSLLSERNRREQNILTRPIIDYTIKNTTRVIDDTLGEIEFRFKNIGVREALDAKIYLSIINADGACATDTAMYDILPFNSEVYFVTHLPFEPFIMKADTGIYLYIKQTYLDTLVGKRDSVIYYQKIWQAANSNSFTRSSVSNEIRNRIKSVMLKNKIGY